MLESERIGIEIAKKEEEKEFLLQQIQWIWRTRDREIAALDEAAAAYWEGYSAIESLGDAA